jgi:mRNA interferase MazF
MSNFSHIDITIIPKKIKSKYFQGDIILIPYPYTDLSNTKKRPALIISKDSINKENYIVVKITSVIRNDLFSFPISPKDVEDGLLHKKSEARVNEVFTIHESIIIKKIASLNKDSLQKLLKKFKENF